MQYLNNKIIILGCLLSMALTSLSVLAHDTNVTHPLITEKALELIKEKDIARQYEELYVPLKDANNIALSLVESRLNGLNAVFRYWGFNPRLKSFVAKRAEEIAEYPCFRTDDMAQSVFVSGQNSHICLSYNFPNGIKIGRTVMEGVVLEDHGNNRVFSHFYHAYAGSAMDMGSPFINSIANRYGRIEPSKTTAIRFFRDSVRLFGYVDKRENDWEPTPGVDLSTIDDYSKKLGYWLFGHSLHHAEDMSSIAHVHNDTHLSLGRQGTLMF